MMSQAVRYITNEAGERVGVLLDVETYERLVASQNNPELLTGLSREELLTLADSTLALEAQSKLSHLLAENAEGRLVASDLTELDHLLTQVDYLNILRARARYTLKHLDNLSASRL